ncbi:IS3 family transposase [Faecalicoccus pleomorphus]|uniref:IS3 family transposase n=1 Tax=Faecalicoccus pleomorphus TaxID=1323 RepID=UPI001F0D7F18|nr:IS3 family transposase [Faecalicoccus pleomorphus]
MEVAIRDESVKKISKKTKANSTTLYNWNKKYVSDELNAQIQKDKLKPDAEIASLKEEIQKLQKDIYQLRMEKEILEKAAELLKKDEGIDINDLTNKEKTIIINALRDHYQLKVLLKSLKMAKSSYFYQLSAISKNKYERIKGRIRKIFNCSYQSYGYRRIKKSLENEGTKISEKVIRRLMKEDHLFARGAQKRRYSSYLGEISPAVPNIINRDFSSESPNKKLLTDITEFHIKNDKVYLSPMIDCFDGYVLSWTIGLSPNAELVNTMLEDTINKLDIEEKPIIHTDRGAHYRWPGWIKIMDDRSLIRSMSKKGCSPDNSACEGFFGRLKNEFYYDRDWSNTSVDEFIEQLNAYIIWYNSKRIKESLGYKSPMDYRKSLGLRY